MSSFIFVCHSLVTLYVQLKLINSREHNCPSSHIELSVCVDVPIAAYQPQRGVVNSRYIPSLHAIQTLATYTMYMVAAMHVKLPKLLKLNGCRTREWTTQDVASKVATSSELFMWLLY